MGTEPIRKPARRPLMTIEQTFEPMTAAEVHAFVAKTQDWWDQLTAREQALFRQVVRAASAESDDVQGYSDIGYAAYQLLMCGNPLPALSLLLAQPVQTTTSVSSG